MSKYRKQRRRKRQYTIGDLDTEIVIHGRAITPPEAGESEFSETFTPASTVWAAVDSVNGKVFFDGVNVDRQITHTIGIRFDATVTEEAWIELTNEHLLDILRVEDMDERSEFMRLTCTERGDKDLGAAQV